MIKDTFNYLYLIVPNEYRCVYYNILDTLGTLGEDLLSSCTATCKGRAITGFACYNMFIAACACYYLGQIKRARVLINYIKAQLEINCNKTIVFEDSTNDEWVVLKVPADYQCIFEKLLNKLSSWGQELLDDCTASCKGKNRNILNSWNLFQAAVTAYEYGNVTKADKIIDHIATTLGFNCSEQPSTDYYTVNIITIPSSATVTINGLSTKSITLPAGSSVAIVVKLSGYYDKTMNIDSLIKDETIEIEFTDEDKIPTTTTYNVTIGTPTPPNAVIKVNGNVKNTGDIMVVTSGTVLNVTAEATGYYSYQENITVDHSMTISPVLNAIPDPNYVYTVIVRVDGTPVDDATIVLTNQTTSESVEGNQITVPANTSVDVVISKEGYETQSFTRVITDTITDIIDLIAEDTAVYIQINGSKQTTVAADRNKVKVYVRIQNEVAATEIPNNTPYRIIPGYAYDFFVVPVDNLGNPDYTDHRIASYLFTSSKTKKLKGTTIKEIVCPRRQNDWMLIIRPAKDNYGNKLEGAEYWDGSNHSSLGGFDGPFGFYYRYYDNNTDFGQHVGITCSGYEGVDYDMYNPNHDDLDITPTLRRNTDSYLIVEPSHQSPYNNQPLYRNISYSEIDFDIVVYPEVTGYRTVDNTPVVGAYLFIDSNLDDGLGNKNVANIANTGIISQGSSTNGPTTPISIVFDNPIGYVVGDSFRGGNAWCGPRYFDIIFDINEENYQPGLEIIATIEDGDSSKQIKFIMPTIPEYENNESQGE